MQTCLILLSIVLSGWEKKPRRRVPVFMDVDSLVKPCPPARLIAGPGTFEGGPAGASAPGPAARRPASGPAPPRGISARIPTPPASQQFPRTPWILLAFFPSLLGDQVFGDDCFRHDHCPRPDPYGAQQQIPIPTGREGEQESPTVLNSKTPSWFPTIEVKGLLDWGLLILGGGEL